MSGVSRAWSLCQCKSIQFVVGGLVLPDAQKRVQEAEAVGERREPTFSPIAGDTACAEAVEHWNREGGHGWYVRWGANGNRGVEG